MECSPVLQHCQPFFKKLLNPNVRDMLVTDMLSLSSLGNEDEDYEDDTVAWDECTTQPIPLDLHGALCKVLDPAPPSKAHFLSHLTVGGLMYTVASKHAGNSHALLKADSSGLPTPFQIDHILQMCISDKIQAFLAVQRYTCQQSKDSDPFYCFPMLQAGLWDDELGPLEILAPELIYAHFAKISMIWEGVDRLVIVSLSCVSQMVLN
jgi:hypothetical protein